MSAHTVSQSEKSGERIVVTYLLIRSSNILESIAGSVGVGGEGIVEQLQSPNLLIVGSENDRGERYMRVMCTPPRRL